MFLFSGMRTLIDDPEVQRIEPDLSRVVDSVMKVFFYGILPRPDGAVAKGGGGNV